MLWLYFVAEFLGKFCKNNVITVMHADLKTELTNGRAFSPSYGLLCFLWRCVAFTCLFPQLLRDKTCQGRTYWSSLGQMFLSDSLTCSWILEHSLKCWKVIFHSVVFIWGRSRRGDYRINLCKLQNKEEEGRKIKASYVSITGFAALCRAVNKRWELKLSPGYHELDPWLLS